MPKPYKPIPRDRLDTMIGCAIHLAWAEPETRFILKAVNGDRIVVGTSHSRRTFASKASDAQYMRSFKP